MIKEDTSDEITEINWDCYDGTDDSVITIDGVSVDSKAQTGVARLRHESREQLEREPVEKSGGEPSLFDRIFKSFFGQD